jgi:hypothetical protein
MSQKFDWQSEEEDSWDDYASNEVEQGTPTRKRRWLLTLLVIPLLLAGAILVFRQLEDYTLAAEMTAENDIISSRNLVQAAAMDADGELLSTVLSGRDPGWTRTQLVLVNSEEFYDREPFGLIWQPQVSPIEVQVTVSPDFNDAVVMTRHKYKLADGEERPQDITLEHSSVFRRGEDRWLMAPPIGDYWGEPITINGRFLSLTFPSRDETIGRRLAADLEEVLSSACSNLDGLECGPDTHLFVHLDTDPQSIIDMAKAETRLRITQDLFLPTPTLVGVPIDESGYRALYRGYARSVASSFLGQVAGWSCCDHLLFYQALLDMQLAELGLGSWPINENQYQLLLDGRGELSEVLWSGEASPPELLEWRDAWQAYVIVEYIVTDWADVPPIEMQRNLTRFTFFSEWLESVSREGAERSFPLGWHSFLQRRVNGT